MTKAQFTVQTNEYQTRIGKPCVAGAYFPKTEEGDEVGVYATPGALRRDGVGRISVMVNLGVAELTIEEARALADTITFHVNQIERGQKA